MQILIPILIIAIAWVCYGCIAKTRLDMNAVMKQDADKIMKAINRMKTDDDIKHASYMIDDFDYKYHSYNGAASIVIDLIVQHQRAVKVLVANNNRLYGV
jgi:hypothetical protein